MTDPKLEAVPNVQIDDGIFKYVLIKVYGKETAEGKETFKYIVRGFERAEWHGKYQSPFPGIDGWDEGGGEIRFPLAATRGKVQLNLIEKHLRYSPQPRSRNKQ